MIVYGKALVEAVQMEENIAKFPRVIVQKDIAELLPQYFLIDEDNLVFLNQFIFSQALEYISSKLQLLEMLKKNPDEKVQQKIMWVINYFNKWYRSRMARTYVRPQITDEEITNILEKSITK